ncbi:phosphoribosylanthranilate isomerase [Lysobacter hankyongensis]|uniref:phosphoribosylanthranilate isomerase n=1 Tax=Lysobacter hankyongensis TaxID=1176535 RepID=UPI0031EF50C4
MNRLPRRTRIKFCGLTRIEDVAVACALGVDAVGFVFAERSKRRVSPAQVAPLREALDPFVASVALFMDNDAATVREVIDTVRPTILQFHGDEDDAFCASFGLPYLKAVAMGGEGARADDLGARYARATGFLFDSHAAGQVGGSGHAFDWTRIPRDCPRPWLLAGGLHPDNVFEAIRATYCWGVDVSSGIESAPGEKDAAKMHRFVEAVRRADAAVGTIATHDAL